jgi:hypothetical protein
MSGSIGPDDEFERLLRGETPETPEEHALGSFLDDVRGAFPAEPPLRMEAHLARVVEAAQLLADKGEPSVRPATKADGRGEQASAPKRRRVIVRVPLMRSLAAGRRGSGRLMSMFGGLPPARCPGRARTTTRQRRRDPDLGPTSRSRPRAGGRRPRRRGWDEL